MAVRPLRLAGVLAALLFLLALPAAARAQDDCPCTVFAPTDAPSGDAVDDSPLEVGMKFRSSEDGYVTALRFYKQPSNTGTHVGHLWSAGGSKLAEVTFTDETAEGWQQAMLPRPVPISSGTTYVVSYHSGGGHFAFSPGTFTSPIVRGPLEALQDGADGGNGVYRYGASGFPTDSWNSSNYWVDVRFERTAADVVGPRVESVAPADGATDVAGDVTVQARFDEDLDPATVRSSSFTLADDSGQVVEATVAYDGASRTALLRPSAPLANGRTYVASVKGGDGGVTDAAGNAMTADRTWSFATTRACPCTIFDSTEGPLGDALVDRPVEVGMKFRSSEDGFITALRFYKQPNNTGRHTGHLWSASGELLAEAPFTNETASGWQEVVLPEPVPIARNTTYVTSYHARDGRFALSGGGLAAGYDRPPLLALADGADGGNGVYRYGEPGFPDQTFNASNYWVDATFERTRPPDTRPPGVSRIVPQDGSDGVPVTTDVRVTFDEPVQPGSVNSGSLILSDETTQVVATVTYDEAARTATLTPSAPLEYGRRYTVTVRSGSTGVVDSAGNQLAADVTTAFATPTRCPCTVFAPTAAPDGDAVKDNPLEIGMKFRTSEDGYVTGLRFYKQPNNSGRHVGSLWSAAGDLLATATFTGETASGWQEADLPNPVAVVKDTVYVVSYYSPNGYYGYTPGHFSNPVDRPPMHAPASGAVAGGNGVYRYGASGFPDQTFNASNYWVDATFERTAPPDTRGPTVARTEPSSDAADVPRDVEVSATFDERLDPASVTASTFTLRDADGREIAADVRYDDASRTARLRPQSPLAYGTRHTATLSGGDSGIRDVSGNPLEADRSWRFTVAEQSPAEGPGGPIVVVADPGDPFSRYYAEILRSEGLNAFSVVDAPVTADKLAGKHVAVLARRALDDAEVAELTTWVQNGGNLVAMRPDERLAGLLGVARASGTLDRGYMAIDRSTAAGSGLDGGTLQVQSSADRYATDGARTIATLYSDATTATPHPAVTLRDVGPAGGQAVMFAYDLARSVVHTRQGNPAWAGDDRDGDAGRRSVDLFYGAKAGDVQPDWVDPERFDVPQADEQQRLLANLITQIALDRAPLPRFGYLPRGEKAAVVLTGDDHATGKTPEYFDRLARFGPDGCSVADWECVRATSYVYPDTPMTDAQAAAYEAAGFEVALHLNTGCRDFTETSLDDAFSGQLGAFAAAYPSVRRPVTNRTHCVIWSDWATQAVVERRHGIRFDTNYYFNGPADWVASRGPGLMTGSGFPQRFADVDGRLIDVYQSTTHVSDEAEQALPTTRQMHALLDNALGPKGYYGVFNVILHSDLGDHQRLTDLVAEAVDRGVPVVSSAQMLEWLDGRNRSSFADLAYEDGVLRFSLITASGTRGLEAMVPLRSTTGSLVRIRRDDAPVSWKPRTLKGVEYAVFRGLPGAYRVTYGSDASPPEISGITAVADDEGRATVRWTTDEPSTSRVDYGRGSTLGYAEEGDAAVTDHELELTGLTPGTTYSYRVTSVDAAGNAATAPALAPATFDTPPGMLVDSRTSEFADGASEGVHAGATLAGRDGEVQLQPAVADEFEEMLVPPGWETTPWFDDGSVEVAGGSLRANGARAATTEYVSAPATLEFTATFQPVNYQGVGFSRTFADYPMAVFGTGLGGQPYDLYATSGSDAASMQQTPLPGVELGVPHRFRIEWRATEVAFYVDGALVATHSTSIGAEMRPIASDYVLHGANVQVQWLRRAPYGTTGTLTSRVLDAGPSAGGWDTLTATMARPPDTGVSFETRSGGTRTPDGTWSAWQPVADDGAIASPPARFIQYRARLSGPGGTTPTLEAVRIGYRPDGLGAPLAGVVTLVPDPPRTLDALTATPSGFSDPDGDELTYHYRWLRNGKPIPAEAGNTLDLALAGNGDRGDTIRVEVYATDGTGAATDPVPASTRVANTEPTAGTVTVRPSGPSSNDLLRATPSGFEDADAEVLEYRYQWFRNGTPIEGATDKTLDLAAAGNGDLGDTIGVEVRAVDGAGGSSDTAAATVQVTSQNSTPVTGSVTLTPESPTTGDVLTATATGFRDPDGDALVYSYRWLVNGEPVPGVAEPSLDLGVDGQGDRGDVISVEVVARDGGGAESEAVPASATVVNSDPAAGTVSLEPSGAGGEDVLTATPSGFADADGDALAYDYRWYRNGTAIPGATGRSLDLADPGHGDPGDTIAVAVGAVDSEGGSSPQARAEQLLADTPRMPVAAFGFEEATGTVAVNSGLTEDGTVSNASRVDNGRFGRALSFDDPGDIVSVADDPALRGSTALTIEAWVRPTSTTDWRSVVFKEADGGLGYALYGNTPSDTPGFRVSVEGDTGITAPSGIEPTVWTHVAATYDGGIMRLFVDGRQVGSRAVPGELRGGAGPLTFGANRIWGEAFAGLLDEIRVYDRRLTREEILADMDRPVVAGTPRPPDDTSPDAIGRFSAVKEWPIVPVHLGLLSDGRVAAWDGFEAAVNSEHLWDPVTEAFVNVPSGRNLFCAGHITLTDGRLMVAGGHVQSYVGTRDLNLFDPATNLWRRGPDMAAARWYPSATMLPGGRIFVASGDEISLGDPSDQITPTPLIHSSSTRPEVYDPASNRWTTLPKAARRMPLYPFLFVLPDGRLFDAGPDPTSRVLDFATREWTVVGESPIDGQSAVMYRPGKILKSGTWAEPEFPGRPVTNRAVAIDMTAAAPAWRDVAPMKYRRAYHTLTVLPDGQVLATGGQRATDGVDQRTGILPAELWDPNGNTWQTMASSRRPRLYHSSALLLPDGRVLLAGGGAYGSARDEASAEIYSPPYLFKGPRPSVDEVPRDVHHGREFTVDSPDAERIRRVSLIRTGSVTHNVDMDTRYIGLSFTRSGTTLRIDGPANAQTAPPGRYMLFLVDERGVPSVGEMVRVDGAADTRAPTAPGSLTAVPVVDGATLTWTASTDDVGVAEYRVYRSTQANFTPSSANRIARVLSGLTHEDRGVPAGVHYYRVRAVDRAGNLSAASPLASTTVVGDVTAPSVSIDRPVAGASLGGTEIVAASASDDVGISSVQFRMDGADLGRPDASAPYAIDWDTRTVADGRHTLTAVARDASGNATTAADVAVEVHNTGAVAAYGFEEPSGATATDAVNRHDGEIVGATRVTSGRFGSALSFDGVDDVVRVPHAGTLSPAGALTVEAWIRPSLLTDWRSVVSKERTGGFAYALSASSDSSQPAARLVASAAAEARAPTALATSTWTHLAMTWDGSVVRLFVDAAEVASAPAAAPLVTNDGDLRIGGGALAGEWFAGLVDEVRVYDRALGPDEIAADMDRPVLP